MVGKKHNITITTIAIALASSILYAWVRAVTLGGFISTLFALYVGFAFGYVNGNKERKQDNDTDSTSPIHTDHENVELDSMGTAVSVRRDTVSSCRSRVGNESMVEQR